MRSIGVRAAMVLLIVSGTFLVASGGRGSAGPIAVADPTVVRQGEASGPSPVILPNKTYIRPDGTVEVVADPKTVAAARSSVAVDYDCGYYCDGKDPNSLLVVTPSGNFYCRTDAVTIYTRRLGSDYAELRFSPRCGTAWTRGCCYRRLAGFGYDSNGRERSSVFNYQGVYSGTPVWTAMLYDAGSLRYKACLDLVVAGSPSEWQCTDRY